MCDTKPKFPKLEARMAELGLNRTTLGERHGMGGQALGRRLRGEIEFDLMEIMWLMTELDSTFDELFSEIN